MEFLCCPLCGKEISAEAEIRACPNCYHPLDKRLWKELKARRTREREAWEEKKAREKERGILDFVRDNFRLFFAILLWIVLISFVISGIYFGCTFGALLIPPNENGEPQILLGGLLFGVVGLILGLLIIIIAGGEIATILSIDENIKNINQNNTLMYNLLHTVYSKKRKEEKILPDV